MPTISSGAPPGAISPGLRRWAELVVGRGARVVAARRLSGGITSVVHVLTVQRGARRVAVVLKQWAQAPSPGLARAIRREAAALGRVVVAGLPAPDLLGASPEGTETGGVPALLLTRLPGRIDLTPRDPEAWLRRMAAMAARIHDADVEAPPFARWIEPSGLEPPRDTTNAALWRAAFATVGREPDAGGRSFVHRDFQHFNLLWSRGRVAGVLDWGGACRGPAEIDVGHCRLNLAVLFSAARAERFRQAYEAEVGRVIDPAWDVHALLAYDASWQRFIPFQVAGRRRVDRRGMTARVETVLAAAMQRLG